MDRITKQSVLVSSSLLIFFIFVRCTTIIAEILGNIAMSVAYIILAGELVYVTFEWYAMFVTESRIIGRNKSNDLLMGGTLIVALSALIISGAGMVYKVLAG